MTEDEIRNEQTEDDGVEAHGLKETAAAGMSAAAMLAAGAGTAAAATPASQATAKPAASTQKADPTVKGNFGRPDATIKQTRADAKPDYTIKLGKKADATIKMGKKGESARADYFLKVDQSE